MEIALEEGADLVGFNIHPPSKRFVLPEKITELITPAVRARSVIVGVDLGCREWSEIIETIRPGYIQLHGSEDAGLIRELKRKFRGLGIIKKADISEISAFGNLLEDADFLLCDSAPTGHGGSGVRFDWSRIRSIPPEYRNCVFLAGGISYENAREALSFGLGGLDTATGSESAPGIKSREKIRLLAREIQKYG